VQDHRKGAPSAKDLEKAEEKTSARGPSESARRKQRTQVAGIKQELFEALQEMRLNKKADRSYRGPAQGPGVPYRGGHREIDECEQRAGLPQRDFRRTLREIRSSAPAPTGGG